MEENTKILVWNIKTFTIHKIGVQATEPGDEHLLRFPRLGYNRFAILETVERINPDIFVVIEVVAGRGATGTLIEGNGQAGLLALLTDLRRDEAKQWCLVPATNLKGTTSWNGESIGVFYQNSRLRFMGPQVWPANSDEDSVAVAPGQQAGPYPAPWNACLPAADNTKAAYVAFRNEHGNLIGFPQRSDRNPMLTYFLERHDRQRMIKLVSVHLPPINTQIPGDGSKPKNPTGAASKEAIARIWNWVPGINPPGANAVTVIAGDFNLNLNNPYVENGLYGKTETVPEDWLFDTGSQKSTMYKTVRESTPYRYLGTALNDNALLRYDYNQHPGFLRGYVADIVAGAFDPAPGTFPDSYPPVPATFDVPLPVLLGYPETDAAMLAVFDGAPNYGHVAPRGGISDHRPIYVEA